MSTQEFHVQVLLEALASNHPKCLTVDQMTRLICALHGKEAAYRAEIETRSQAESCRAMADYVLEGV